MRQSITHKLLHIFTLCLAAVLLVAVGVIGYANFSQRHSSTTAEAGTTQRFPITLMVPVGWESTARSGQVNTLRGGGPRWTRSITLKGGDPFTSPGVEISLFDFDPAVSTNDVLGRIVQGSETQRELSSANEQMMLAGYSGIRRVALGDPAGSQDRPYRIETMLARVGQALVLEATVIYPTEDLNKQYSIDVGNMLETLLVDPNSR